MPLNKTCSFGALKDNVRAEIDAGKTPEQAYAIAQKTLETACMAAGKPVPREAVLEKAAGKERSREYLEAALEQAKKLLPGWMYVVLHRAALPASGGRAAVNRRLAAALEKVWVDPGWDNLTDLDLSSLRDLLVDAQVDAVCKQTDSRLTDSQLLTLDQEIARRQLAKATRTVPFAGPRDAPLVFVASAPSELELLRQEAVIGPDGVVFAQKYLEPLGLTRKDVAVGFAIPVQCDEPTADDIDKWRGELLKEVAQYPKSRVVALGRVAKEAVGPLAVCKLPHPAALRRHRDSGEVGRKLGALAKRLDKMSKIEDTDSSSPSRSIEGPSGTNPPDSTSGLRGEFRLVVTKAAAEKQIVYGVVLDPYQVDLQGDWIPPAEIESTAHDFLEKSRVIGLQHSGKADAQVVESWVEMYPSEEDRAQALQNAPHKVFRRKFGSDTIHSGAWMAGVKLCNKLWKSYKKGDLDAFSIGGFSLRSKITSEAMPKVTYVDLTSK